MRRAMSNLSQRARGFSRSSRRSSTRRGKATAAAAAESSAAACAPMAMARSMIALPKPPG
jgi:hypothetical protein